MRLRNSLVPVIAVLCLAGCLQTQNSKRHIQIDTCEGMADYLRAQNIPTLESVDEWDNQYGDGLVITTNHYRIFTTLLEPLMLSQIPGFMESAYRGYQNQFPKKIATANKFDVYLFATRKQWDDFTIDFTGSQAPLYHKIKKGAYCLNGACVAYNIGRERTFSVLGHEGWHQFNSRHFKYRLPSWLDEGIAMQFEANKYENGLFVFDPALNLQRLGTLKQTMIKKKMIPLKNLVGMNPGEVLVTEDSDSVGAFYSQSYALTRFLREENYGKRLASYHQMLMGGLNGSWPLDPMICRLAADRNIPLTIGWNRIAGTKLFEEYISDDFDKIEKEYITFCRKIVYHIRFR